MVAFCYQIANRPAFGYLCSGNCLYAPSALSKSARQIVERFQADRQPDQAVGNAVGQPLARS